MSLKQKLGILLLALFVIFSAPAWVVQTNDRVADNLDHLQRVVTILLSVSKELPYAKLLVQSHQLERKEILPQISDDMFLMQQAIKVALEYEDDPEIVRSLRDLQLDLSAIDLLLRELSARPVGRALSPEDVLKLEQLSALTAKVENVVATYTQYLNGVKISIQQQLRLATYAAGALLVLALAGIVGFFYYNVLRPVVALTRAAEAINAENYDYQAQVGSKDEFNDLANAFNAMTARLRESIQTLEQRVVDRTQRLEAVADLNERLSAILDFDQLLQEMVEQVKKRFGYYHAHVYIIDNDRQNLIMTAGAGGPGRQMKAAGHHISLSAPKSLVARAARSGEIVWVDNVREDPEWLPNPLLPDTWSEMAVPVTVEGKIVGVLDVQQNAIGGLDESDAGLLRSLAGHVAVAIRNAQLFANVENALAEAQRMQAQYLEQSWLRSNIAAMKGQHAYIAPTALSPDEAAPQPQYMNQIRRQALNSDKPIIVDLDTEGNTNSKSVISPVTLRGQIIGALHLHPGNRQRDWSQQDIAMIQVVANRLAQTAENLRLFEETRENVNREKAIREITNKLRAAPNLDILLETAAREISQRLNVSHTVLEMGIDSKN